MVISSFESTLGLLHKVPFKLTQLIHIALQKSYNFDWKLLELFIFDTKTNKGEIGLYFGNNEEKYYVAPQVRKWTKKTLKTDSVEW